MKNWQKNRNYRKVTDDKGIVSHIITIEGEDVKVRADIFETYSSMDRRERYSYERESGLLLSLEMMDEDNLPLSSLVKNQGESAEDIALRDIEFFQLHLALDALSSEELELIDQLFELGHTEKYFAQCIGVSQVAIHKRKKRLLKKLLRLMGY